MKRRFGAIGIDPLVIERDLDAEFIRLTLQSFVQAGDGVFGKA